MMIKALAVGVGFVLAGASPVWAQEPSYDIQDVQACSQDAMRLCRDKLPDLDAIESCMKAHYEKLRPACQARFAHQR